MSFSIRMTEEEKKLAESYARMHSISLALPCTISSANVRQVGLPQLPQSYPGSVL